MLAFTSSGRPPRTTTSLTANRPPGLSTRNDFGQHFPLVAGQVDHAVRDDHVNGIRWQRNRLDVSLEELDVRRARLLLVLEREAEHLVGHVESVRLPCGADALGGQQHVDATTRPEVEDGLAFVQLGQRRRIAAAERREKRLGGKSGCFTGVVEVGGDRVPRLARRSATPARSAATRRVGRTLGHALRDRTVSLAHRVADRLQRRCRLL